tara:strand:+ start:343 stop:888 length:546 start_codon:yes stop_codon:yes gene_type:complete
MVNLLSYIFLAVGILTISLYKIIGSGSERVQVGYPSVQQSLIFIEKGDEVLEDSSKYFKKDENVLKFNDFFEMKENDLLNKDLIKTGAFYHLYDEKTLFFIGPENYIDQDGSVIEINKNLNDVMMSYLEEVLVSRDKDMEKYIVGKINDGDFVSLRKEYKKHFDNKVLSDLKERVVVVIKQ